MDHIDQHLATAALNEDYPTSIKAALAIGKTTLNRYYNKTDHSEVFRIAMGKLFKHSLTIFLLIYIYSQFYTLNTNLVTLRRLDGRKIG